MTHLNTILDLYGFNESEQIGLLSALDLINFQIENYSTAEETLTVFSDALQILFPRPEGMERQQISDKFTDPALRAQLLPLLSAFTQEITAGNDVAYKLLLGANEIAMRERFDCLVNLNNKNHYTEMVYPLGGERKLWAIAEITTAKLVTERLSTPKDVEEKFAEIFTKVTEMEHNRELYTDEEISIEVQKSRLESIRYFTELGIIWPTETDMINVLIAEYHDKLLGIEFKPVINAPKKLNHNGELVRPNTIDTYKKLWEIYGDDILKRAVKEPNGKLKMAIISNQPFARAQEQQAIDYFLDKPVDIDIVASAVINLEDANISKLFRSFAETIHAGKGVALTKLAKPLSPEL